MNKESIKYTPIDDDDDEEECSEKVEESLRTQTSIEECESKDMKVSAIKYFAKELIAIFENRVTDEEKRFKEFFGVDKQEIKLMVQYVAPYQRSEAIYALNEFIAERCKDVEIENYNDDKLPPVYESIEIKKENKRMLITVGYFFLKWKRTKFLVDLYFQGTTRMYRIWFTQKDEDKALRLQKAILEFFHNYNFLKGERLLFLPYAYMDFLDYPKLSWSDVILSKENKEEFITNLLFPLSHEKECKENGIPWRRGLMLAGFAGIGKTQVCRVLCNVLPKDITLIWATPKALFNEKMIQELFEAARFFSPTLIIIEDIDFIGLNRNFAQNPILGELLTQLDGNDPNDGLFVIATTNKPELLDEALANRPSRFDIQLLFDLPDNDGRKRIIELFTKDMEFAEELNMNQIVEATRDLTGSHIKEIFVHCQLKALKENRKVTNKDILEKALKYKSAIKKATKAMIS